MAASPFALSSASTTTRPIWRFGLLCAAFALLWAIGSIYGLGVSSPLDTALCNQLASSAAWGLRMLGWVASTDSLQPSLLLLDGRPSVIVGAPCDGLVLYVLLAGFVLAYPGPPQRRLWFIPLGIVALWLLNIVRILVLSLNHEYSPDTFDFDHHYAFNAIAYAALGGFWWLWTRQASAVLAPAERVASASPVAPMQSWLTPRIAFGLALLVILVLNSIFRTQLLGAFSTYWAAALALGPAWLHRLPGADVGAVPAGVSRLALPVGALYTVLFLANALLTLYILLPAKGWRVAWRCYAGMLLLFLLLVLAGRLGVGQEAYRISRMLLDFMVSLLPIAGLLVLLWRPVLTATEAATASE